MKKAPDPIRHLWKEYKRLPEELEVKLALKIIKAFHKESDIDQIVIWAINKALKIDFNKAWNPFPTIRFGLCFDLYEIDRDAKYTQTISDDDYISRAKKVLNIDI